MLFSVREALLPRGRRTKGRWDVKLGRIGSETKGKQGMRGGKGEGTRLWERREMYWEVFIRKRKLEKSASFGRLAKISRRGIPWVFPSSFLYPRVLSS